MAVVDINGKLLPILNQKDLDRFWSKVSISSSVNSCWDWKGWVRSADKPYGKFVVRAKTYSAHRISYFIATSIDPKDLHTLHACDNPKCVNPNHLFLGTNKDNVADKVMKGRQSHNIAWNKGLSLPTKLETQREVFLEAKSIYEQGGISLYDLGKRYGTSKKTLATAFRQLGGVVEYRKPAVTPQDVKNIRERYSQGVRQIDICLEFDLKKPTVNGIVNRKTWKNI